VYFYNTNVKDSKKLCSRVSNSGCGDLIAPRDGSNFNLKSPLLSISFEHAVVGAGSPTRPFEAGWGRDTFSGLLLHQR